MQIRMFLEYYVFEVVFDGFGLFEDKRSVSKCVVVCVSEREFVKHHLRIILPNPHRETTKVRTAGKYSCIHTYTHTQRDFTHEGFASFGSAGRVSLL